jgi:hypothetical protein
VAPELRLRVSGGSDASTSRGSGHGNLSDLFGFLSLGWGNIGIFWFGVMLGFGLSGGAFWN